MHTCRLGCLLDTQAVYCAGRWVDESGLQESSRLTIHIKQLSVYTRYEMARLNSILGINKLKWTGMGEFKTQMTIISTTVGRNPLKVMEEPS